MEQRISLITLGVADLDRSRAFYERLGWRRSVANADGVAFFQAGGMVLSLFPRIDLAKDAKLSAAGEGFGGITLAYNARTREEVDAVLAEAVAAGATLLKAAEDAFWGGWSGSRVSVTCRVIIRGHFLQENARRILYLSRSNPASALFRLLRRSRQLSLGGRMESLLPHRGRR